MNELGKKTRPWGSYNTIIHEPEHFVRYLTFKPDEELSVSKHQHREEHWVILKGCALIIIDGVKKIMFPGEGVTVYCNQIHQIVNRSYDEELVILETAYGSKTCDSDIIRISDKYGR